MRRRGVARVCALVFALQHAAIGAGAEGSDTLPDPAAVIAAYNARDEGEHLRRIVTITLRNKRGRDHVRQALICRKYYGTEKRTVLFFLEPASVRKTAFLTYDYAEPGKEDDQWLFLPSTRKVRRINAGDRGGWFLGTDFTYEDIKKETKISAEDFAFRLLGTEEVNGHLCWKVETTPLTPRIAKDLRYARAVHWFDREILLAHKSEFFDGDGDRLRSLLASDIAQIEGIWTVQRVTAINHRSRHTTEFRFTEIEYKTPVDDSMFTRQALVRGYATH